MSWEDAAKMILTAYRRQIIIKTALWLCVALYALDAVFESNSWLSWAAVITAGLQFVFGLVHLWQLQDDSLPFEKQTPDQ